MRNIVLFLFAIALTITTGAPAQKAEYWRAPYVGADASGDHVLGFWNFEGTDDTVADRSGKGHHGTFAGAERSAEGRFGSGLRSYPGWPVSDERHAAIVPDAPELSPRGAFTLELWLRPAAEMADYGNTYLIDKRYVAHTDYQWILGRPDKAGQRTLRLVLGFGDASETWFSPDTLALETDVWVHLAVTYDGAGTVEFFRNGETLGGATKTGRGAVTPGSHHLSLGDRIGSYHYGVPGVLDEIRITSGVREFRPITVAARHRRQVYRRMEPGAQLSFELKNVQRDALQQIRCSVRLNGEPVLEQTLDTLAVGAAATLSLPLDTRWRPGKYNVEVAYELDTGDSTYRNVEQFPLTIVPRPLPHRMPVVMWGLYNPAGVEDNLPLLRDLGFTHCLGLRANYDAIWESGEAVPAASDDELVDHYRMLDKALEQDLGVIASLSNGHWMDKKEELLRINAEGTTYERVNPCCLFPEVLPFSRNVGASVARTYGEFPAFEGALINTEVRDSSQVCFHAHDRAAYRAATGFEYPELVKIKNGVPFGDIPDFPADRVVPDDHELLQFYRWFWRQGDGWNPVHSAVHDGLMSGERDDLWTFFDPAVRVPSLWGSGGHVDYVSHWTYTYPDPVRMGLATDELFAMAAGQPEQSVMKMTQIIWYRSQTAPAPDGAAPGTVATWEDYDPDAAYITIAPMHLKEAFWLKMARPIQGIMYHGWQSLVPTESTSAYRYTHPETQNVLRELVRDVVEPLGPALMQIPAAPAQVAFLESFTSQMLARRGTYGWGGSWAGDAYHIVRYAHLQPEIVYEETIARDGLDGYDVLVMADCDVLTESIVAAVKAFQARGGVVVGDERLCPAITADIRLQVVTRTKNGAADKAALVEQARALREQLAPHHQPFVSTDVADVLSYHRRFGSTDYLFAINDRREYGDYVGQHGLVMENGLPAQATLTAQRTGHVYDLLQQRELQAETVEGTVRLPVTLEPGGGRLFMVTEKPIAAVRVQGSDRASRGRQHLVSIAVVDAEGGPIDAVVPLEVAVRDPNGRVAEFSGHYGAAGGTLDLNIDVAPNDTLGMWTVQVRELASGREGLHFFRVGE